MSQTIELETAPQVAPAPPAAAVWRIEIRSLDPRDDPAGQSALAEAREAGLGEGLSEVHTARIYLIEGVFTEPQITRLARQLLADPVHQTWTLGAETPAPGSQSIEVHYLPGVMDPVAQSASEAAGELLEIPAPAVRTGWRYDLAGASENQARLIAQRLLANTVVQSIHLGAHWPERFPQTSPYRFRQRHIPLRELDDAQLEVLSRQGHLFLSLEEMQALRAYYRGQGREPSDIELETIAQTWSEHCVHKTLKSTVRYREEGPVSEPSARRFASRAGHAMEPDGTLVIENLLKSTVAAATRRLIEEGLSWCVSVFVDNAGVIRFDDTHAVTFKVETHNHPSAIEPYGGAATGIGGCIRDTMGTGLGARPIANTDVFAVADPGLPFESLPRGVLHPRRVLKQVVAGVRDYGNRMGIPTVNGAVAFDDRYLGNPLVFAGSVGLIPLDKCFGSAQAGDRIVAIGGRTGRDGIHGATFSSAELTDTHADEFSHAVQIGNAITQKKALDVILQARDHASGCLYRAITDCGAGGFSSAVGEMGAKLGAQVDLEKAPLKYDGLSYTEIWISEAQERMVLAVPPENVEKLFALCAAEDVEACDLGVFGTPNAELILRYHGTEVGRLSMHFLHEGIPTPHRQALWAPAARSVVPPPARLPASSPLLEVTRAILQDPNVASKHWIIRQYDHEVQGGSVVKPLTGPEADGPSDAAVLRPKLESDRGISLSCGLATPLGDVDPYWMTLAAIDEAVRNAVCVGADPDRIAILDNFCWPNCQKPANLGSLVRAAEGCYDGAMAYRTPFISGKDSLNNEFRTEDGRVIAIPPTLLISSIGMVENVTRCLTMDAKKSGHLLVVVGTTCGRLGASFYHRVLGAWSPDIPKVDLEQGPRQLRAAAALIASGLAVSAHDCSEGGLLLAAVEMAMAGRLGVELDLDGVATTAALSDEAICFAETPSRILLEIAPENLDTVARRLRESGVAFGCVGRFDDSGRAKVKRAGRLLDDGNLSDLHRAWRAPLDW